ncbi:SMI1/KNR4 family protein [Streptococcus constellatus]|uniref:SMI1/KNR4 family protein n=1 Tax=Streptococcus constellatus TaxID=76860 RepID=UPI00210446CE|nr:SMI1/KNR4 family protein [Streptococcus constellatus]UTX65163.1 SMI1/KNR4 family protein [Streptococcus constellatus]
MELSKHGKRLIQQDIVLLETRLDVMLPEDYASFLLANNVASPKQGYISLYSEQLSEKLYVAVFLGESTNPEFDILTWNSEYQGDMPQHTIIFALEENDGMFIMVTTGEDRGIYYWDNTYSFEQSSDEGNTYFLADNFTEFLAMITSEN